MDTTSPSLFDLVIARPRPWWVTMGIILLLIASPLVAAMLDGLLSDFFGAGYWRPFLLAPVVIGYILVITSVQTQSQATVIATFRPLARVDDDEFNASVRQASHISRTGEFAAMGVGLLFGVWLSGFWRESLETPWLKGYISIALSLMMGLLAWIIFGVISSTGLMAVLHRLPLQVDILDRKPFEPIGKHSLTVTLIFVGGIVLGIIFGLDVQNIRAWQTWFFYVIIAIVPVLVFFLNMRHTHRILVEAKKHELAVITQRLQRARNALRQHIAQGEAFGATASEFSALVAYETRVRAAQTWPYNMSMLRTLVLSLLMPLLVRWLSTILFG